MKYGHGQLKQLVKIIFLAKCPSQILVSPTFQYFFNPSWPWSYPLKGVVHQDRHFHPMLSSRGVFRTAFSAYWPSTRWARCGLSGYWQIFEHQKWLQIPNESPQRLGRPMWDYGRVGDYCLAQSVPKWRSVPCLRHNQEDNWFEWRLTNGCIVNNWLADAEDLQ